MDMFPYDRTTFTMVRKKDDSRMKKRIIEEQWIEAAELLSKRPSTEQIKCTGIPIVEDGLGDDSGRLVRIFQQMVITEGRLQVGKRGLIPRHSLHERFFP